MVAGTNAPGSIRKSRMSADLFGQDVWRPVSVWTVSEKTMPEGNIRKYDVFTHPVHKRM
jgi:hypothetical protein